VTEVQAEVGLLDTSVFIARESGRVIAQLPHRVALSVITIGELQLGVLNARDPVARS
jgi:predicted nucleic acid-binding protein